MKDLFVLTADLDAKVVIQAILQRRHSLSIHPVSFDVDRHTMRDAGVVKDGPELVRSYKGKYRKVLLLWDHRKWMAQARPRRMYIKNPKPS